jgi:2-aminoadipate transaminase
MNSQIPVETRQYKKSCRHFAKRMEKTPKSFIREILKVTEDPSIISFAGGLPNPALIDVNGISVAAKTVLSQEGRSVLQYSTTEGYLPLRQFIAERYRKRLGLSVSPEEILITNGSQQCLDLIGKIYIDNGDHIAIERPGYLGAIQAFSLYEPVFHPVVLNKNGLDPIMMAKVLETDPIKLFYGIPNSQNPSGITYTNELRRELAPIFGNTSTLFIEDDAYGELNFSGKALSSMREFLPDQTIITGSFSKILAPGMRLGWMVAQLDIMEQLVIAKQASDLHSNYLSQRIAFQYLHQQNIDDHIRKICEVYKTQCHLMIDLIEEKFPESVDYTEPEGGMFIWLTLPDGIPSTEVFEQALKDGVAVLPGTPFYTDGGGSTTIRLNFSNSTEEKIKIGIERLSKVLRNLMKNTRSSQGN